MLLCCDCCDWFCCCCYSMRLKFQIHNFGDLRICLLFCCNHKNFSVMKIFNEQSNNKKLVFQINGPGRFYLWNEIKIKLHRNDNRLHSNAPCEFDMDTINSMLSNFSILPFGTFMKFLKKSWFSCCFYSSHWNLYSIKSNSESRSSEKISWKSGLKIPAQSATKFRFNFYWKSWINDTTWKMCPGIYPTNVSLFSAFIFSGKLTPVHFMLLLCLFV